MKKLNFFPIVYLLVAFFFVACDFDVFITSSIKLTETTSTSPFLVVDNNLYKAENKVEGRFDSSKNTIVIFNEQTSSFENFAGSANTSIIADGNGSSASFNNIQSMYYSNYHPDIIWLIDNCLIRTLNIKTKNVVTLAGKLSSDLPLCTDSDGSNATAGFQPLTSIAVDLNNIYVSSAFMVRKLNIDGSSSTILSGVNSRGDVIGSGAESRYQTISSILLINNRLWISDSDNKKIKSIDINSGDSEVEYGDGSSAILDGPSATALVNISKLTTLSYDQVSRIYFTDQNTVRFIDLNSNTISTMINPSNIAEDNLEDLVKGHLFFPNFLQWTPRGLFISNTHGIKLVN